MKEFNVCPVCGQPTIKVKNDAVKNAQQKNKDFKADKGKWLTCINKECDVIYIQGDKLIRTGDILQVPFFKDSSAKAIVCSCYGITRGEMKVAVENGCTNKSQISKYHKKKKQGSCESNNPLGKSCSNLFQYELNKLINLRQ